MKGGWWVIGLWWKSQPRESFLYQDFEGTVILLQKHLWGWNKCAVMQRSCLAWAVAILKLIFPGSAFFFLSSSSLRTIASWNSPVNSTVWKGSLKCSLINYFWDEVIPGITISALQILLAYTKVILSPIGSVYRITTTRAWYQTLHEL